MLPTLIGRIQTRVFLLLVVGGLVTLVLTPLLPLDGSIGHRYGLTYTVLVTVTVLGVGWEFLYHFLQQFRWEKDWPTLFGLVTFVNEGLLVWALLLLGWIPFFGPLEGAAASVSFWVLFVVVWLAVWFVANGPMRVPFIRWRFRGGRLL